MLGARTNPPAYPDSHGSSRAVLLADISEPKSKEPSPSPLQVKGRQLQAVVLSDSEDDQRVPDTVEKAPPTDEAVDLTSPAKSQSHDTGTAAAPRLSQGTS